MKSGRNEKKSFLAAIFLVFALGMMLAACGTGSKTGGNNGADAGAGVPGVYVGNFDMTEFLNQETEAGGIQFNSKVSSDFILELNDDDTFALDIDPDSLISSVKDAVQDELDSIIGGIMGQEVTEDSADEIAKAAGYDSYDAFKEDIRKQITESLDEDAFADMEKSCHVEGTYTIKGKDLKLSAGDTEGFSVKVGTIQDDGSILLDVDANDQDVQITFVKQK